MAAPAKVSDELAPFVLQNVEGLSSGDTKGSGAYGAVYEVTVTDVKCIAKRLHDILISPDVSQRERASIQEKFRQECILLSKLRHPNIVHFVGVHYGHNPADLTLIMERLHTDLGNFLDNHPAQIPLPVKLSILLDISYGLLYLHSHSPPIVHRDLSANNILLTKDCRAVIADLGVSKLLDLQRQTKTHTKAPGTLYYMPPEALKERPVYDVSLDAFSFGHLSLYVANQDFPHVYEVTMTQLVVQQQTIQISKRRRAIDLLGEDHCLYPMIIRCLQDLPEGRPTASELNSTLKLLAEKHPRSLDDVMEASGQVQRPENSVLVKELRSELEAVKAEMEDLKQKEESARLQWESMRDSCRALHQKNQELFTEKLKLEEENTLFIDNVEKIALLGNDNADLQRTIIAMRKEKEDLWNELQAVKAEDFDHEREDRAKAHSQMEDIRTKFATELEEARRELQFHKERLTEVEAVNSRKVGELKSALEEALAALQEVQAKTSRIMQYRKQVDSLKAQVSETEKQHTNLIQELERVRNELVR